jgi:hypothetical protein
MSGDSLRRERAIGGPSPRANQQFIDYLTSINLANPTM